MVVLRGSQIGHTYRYHQVLHDVSLELHEGDCFALFGPNGTGKTTLMKIFATLLTPTEGGFEVMGTASVHREAVRRHLFLIGHESFLYDDLTAVENIEFAMGLRGVVPPHKEIMAALDRTGIGPFALHKSRHLSSGMKKRLALAKALLARPALILLDEPYVALDQKGAEVMNDCIHEWLENGSAVLMSGHEDLKTAGVARRSGILQNKTLSEFLSTALDKTRVEHH